MYLKDDAAIANDGHGILRHRKLQKILSKIQIISKKLKFPNSPAL